jgi:DNA invertase Pin-like site-specific DNA recombinase
MKIGYARVSTLEQNPDLQHDALKKAGCKKIYTDNASGVKAERPALNEILEFIRRGDCLVVWRLDRLGRSLKNLIEVVEDLENRKVGFMSLQEGINTTTAGGRLVFHLFGALSEFERNLIRERTCAGLAAARARGRMGGRKHKLKPAQVKTLRSMYDSRKHTIKEICKVMGISKPTLYEYLKRGQ